MQSYYISIWYKALKYCNNRSITDAIIAITTFKWATGTRNEIFSPNYLHLSAQNCYLRTMKSVMVSNNRNL